MINDVNGFPLGRNNYGRPVNLDLWSRDGNNILIVGPTNSGKTVTVKHTILHQYYRGVKVIVIDVDREYKDLCEALGGYWIDGDSDYIDFPKEILLSNFVVIDMYGLKSASDELRASHYDKVLSWCWSRMILSVDERVLLVVDDLKHFDVGKAHDRLGSMHRSCRLHNSGMLLVAATSDELTYEMAGNSTYIVLMCVGGRKIENMLYLCNFSEDDVAFMSQRSKWTALLSVGIAKEQVTIEIP